MSLGGFHYHAGSPAASDSVTRTALWNDIENLWFEIESSNYFDEGDKNILLNENRVQQREALRIKYDNRTLRVLEGEPGLTSELGSFYDNLSQARAHCEQIKKIVDEERARRENLETEERSRRDNLELERERLATAERSRR